MKIAHITPVYPPHIGGIGTVAQEYANALTHDGEEVTVFTPQYFTASPPSQGGVKGGCQVLTEQLKPWYQWGNAALIPQLFWKLRSFDVIHLHYPCYGAAEVTALAALIWRKPLILTYHMKTVANGWLGWIFQVYRSLVEPVIFSIADVLCVSSLDYAESVGLRADKLIELPFSVDAERFHPGDAPNEREALGIPRDAKVILFVGGLDDAHYFKGVDVLIEACARLTVEEDWRLLIVGDGNRRSMYAQLADQKGIKERVIFAGRVSQEALPEYYRAANVHVLPAVNTCEAFGLVTLEAAASGLPSIVSNLPGVRTLVEERQTGLLVVPGDTSSLTLALRFLLQKDEVRFKLSQNARERIERLFSPDVIFKQLKEVYRIAVEGR